MIRQCGFAVKACRGSVCSCFGMRGLSDESEPLCVDIMMGGGFIEPLLLVSCHGQLLEHRPIPTNQTD